MNTAEWSVSDLSKSGYLRLQWSRRVNTAEWSPLAPYERERVASMEPPCEHGGVNDAALARGPQRGASMEPPCEHGGVRIGAPVVQLPLTSFNGAAV